MGGGGFDSGPVSDVPGYLPPARRDRPDRSPYGPPSVVGPPGGNALASRDAMDPTSGIDVDQAVVVSAPVLAGGRRSRRDDDQTYYLHSAIIRKIPLSAYAIPRAALTLDKEGTKPASAGPQMTPATPALPPKATPVQPDIKVGSEVFGPDHLPLTVLGADAANVIVEGTRAIHFAVGAGSCILVQTNGGWYLFDAGINLTEPHALAEAIARKVVANVGNDAIRATFLTHAHFDHTAMLEFLARHVQIDAIVANPQQFMREVYAKIRDAMRAEDLKRREAERQKLYDDKAERKAFEESLRDKTDKAALNDADIDGRWRTEVGKRIDARYPVLRELAALPMRGSNRFDTVYTKPLHGANEGSMRVEDLLPSQEGTELRGVVDPDVHRAEHGPMQEHEVDRGSTTYVLTVNGRRLIVMPDLRRTDIGRIKDMLTEALGSRNVEFQEWVLGHHMQVGFEEGPVSGETLMKSLELLHDFRARGAGPSGRPGRDAVIASVDPKQVDPAQIRLLKLIGFEVYLAQSQADVHTYEVLAGGKLLRGVRAPLSPDAVGAPTLQRSIIGRRDLETRKAALESTKSGTTGKGSRAIKKSLSDDIEKLEAKIDNITALEHALVAAVHAEPFDEQAARRIEADLNKALDAEGLGRVVTSSSQLTDSALVILREPLGPEPPAGTPAADARARDLALREQKNKVDLLREHIKDVAPAARQDAYAELYAELAAYEHQLTRTIDSHPPGVAQDIARAERDRVQADRVQLENSFTSRKEAVRLPDGQLAETRVVRIKPGTEGAGAPRPPSPAARAMLKGLELTSRPLGAFMVISTIRGSKDLIDRYEEGEANLTQLGIGGIRNVTSGVVGLRMLKGARVGTGVFIAISVLEIAEAVAGDYDSESQRRRAVDSAVRGAAINTGCMLVGEALIATMNPFGIAAGVIIMFLGPWILGKLFDDTPEELYPDIVTDTGKTLKKLLDEYAAVIGGLRLAKRDSKQREAIGLTADVSRQAASSVLNHRARALFLEQLLLRQFEAAYDETREGRAGLREIDEMRRQFLALRQEASTDWTDEEARAAINQHKLTDPRAVPYPYRLLPQYDAQGKVIPIRELTLQRLRAMEGKLSLDNLTADQIRDMDQWKSIRENALDLTKQVLREQALDPDWADIGQRQHDLEARVASARYRLDPAAQAEDPKDPARDVPLLAPGSEARRAYEEKLAEAEGWLQAVEMFIVRSHFRNLRAEHVDTPNIDALSTNSHYAGDMTVGYADDSLDLLETTIKLIGGPPAMVGGVEQLYREPTARSVYLAALTHDRTFRKNMNRLQVNDVAARSLMRSLEGQAAKNPALRTQVDKLRERYRALQNDRTERRGILFAYEVEALGVREKQRAIAYFTPLLGGTPADPVLTREEIVAAETGDYGDVGKQLVGERRTIAERLAQIPNLRIPTGPVEIRDASGTPMRVSRVLSGIMRLDGLTAQSKLLVGIVDWHPYPSMVKVIPLNDAAVGALGGYAPTLVLESRLMSANEDDLSP